MRALTSPSMNSEPPPLPKPQGPPSWVPKSASRRVLSPFMDWFCLAFGVLLTLLGFGFGAALLVFNVPSLLRNRHGMPFDGSEVWPVVGGGVVATFLLGLGFRLLFLGLNSKRRS